VFLVVSENLWYYDLSVARLGNKFSVPSLFWWKKGTRRKSNRLFLAAVNGTIPTILNEVKSMRMRKKKNLLPRMERVANIQEKDPYGKRGHWRDWMPQCKGLYLEIGCGKGTFTVKTAAANPDILFVAVERVADCILLAMEKAQEMNLKNVVFVCDDAAKLGEMFAPGEVDRMYINFCDPWPSKRHAKRRLTYEAFLKSYREILPMGGEIHFKTDNRPLFDFSLTQFPRAGYVLSEVTNDLHADDPTVIMTDYEARFAAEGAKINRCVGTVAELPTQLGEEPELGLIHYLPYELETLDYIPYGMKDLIEQELLRRRAEERKAQRQKDKQN
jgi:tRNA (guanine-N7-)-methyltransferase